MFGSSRRRHRRNRSSRHSIAECGMEVGVMAKVARRGWIFGWVWYTLGRNHRECRHSVHTTLLSQWTECSVTHAMCCTCSVSLHDVGIKTDHFGVPGEGMEWGAGRIVVADWLGPIRKRDQLHCDLFVADRD